MVFGCISSRSLYFFLLFFSSISRYLDYLPNVDNNFFHIMGNQINPPELQLNMAGISDIKAPFWIYIHLYRKALLRLKLTIYEMILIKLIF